MFLLFLLTFRSFELYENVSYGTHPLQSCDVYVPLEDSIFPVLIIVHGGAWVTGDKRKFSHIAEHFAEKGHVVVNINYRLAPTYTYPAQPHDVALAIQWIKKNAEKYKADPQKICLYGHSAGGHLVSLVGLTPEKKWTEDTITSIFVNGVISTSGVYDFDLLPEDGKEAVMTFLGNSSYWDEAQPINHTKTGNRNTKFLIIHGTEDELIHWSNADSFHNALIKDGYSSRFILLEGYKHGDPVNLFTGEDTVAKEMEEFLENLWNTGIRDDTLCCYNFTPLIKQKKLFIPYVSEVKIFDITGTLLLKQSIDKPKVIDLNRFCPGIYFYILNTEKNVYKGKIIILKGS